MQITAFGAHQQGTGEFDGGKIMEQKPIAFSGEATAVKRVGPLFYWAWGFSKKGGKVPLHPHRGFEIMSYVLSGNMAHQDSLGNRSVVGPGGVQVMQTGTGVFHEEESFGDRVEGFQVWFEPDLLKSISLAPTYRQFENNDFPASESDGNTLKTIIGHLSPLTLMADAKMWDLKQTPGSSFSHPIPAGYSLALLVIRGSGTIMDPANGGRTLVDLPHKHFVVIDADERSEVIFQSRETGMQTIIIQVPTVPDYSLYPKR